MVTQWTPPDPGVYRAIADPTRRAILDLLRDGRRSAGDVAAQFPVSRPAISRHLRVLHRASLVRETRESQTRWYALDAAPLAAVDHWLAAYRVQWAARLHDLKRYVEDQESR